MTFRHTFDSMFKSGFGLRALFALREKGATSVIIDSEAKAPEEFVKAVLGPKHTPIVGIVLNKGDYNKLKKGLPEAPKLGSPLPDPVAAIPFGTPIYMKNIRDSVRYSMTETYC